MKNYIDLRSDTVTRPTKEMLSAMLNAEVGDDVFGEDPTVNLLEEKIASIFGKESAVFCPSGTMANQIAIKIHCNSGDEVLCHEFAHVYKYEGGGMASNAGCSVKFLPGERGVFTAKTLEECINPEDDHFPVSKLVVVENTCNRAGGTCYKRNELESIASVCKINDLKLHLDGARFFNALIAQKENITHYTNMFHTLSICLSKGLGAPVGSVLLGSNKDIKQARRYRKSFGGGMRQAGYLAAAGLYALENNINRLVEDHARAKSLERVVAELTIVKQVLPVETNIVIFEIDDKIDSQQILQKLKNHGILVVEMGKGFLRMVTHLDFDDNKLERVVNILKAINRQ